MHITLETPGGTGLYLSYNVIAWMFTVILIALGLWQITLKKSVTLTRLHLYSLIGFIFLLIPLSYGHDFSDHAIPRVLGLAAGLLLLFCLSQFDELKQKPEQTLWWVLIAVAIQACFGLVQYFVLEAGDWGGYQPEIGLPHGSFLQRNVMASFMTTGIALSLYLGSKAKYKQHDLLKWVLIYFTLFSSSFLIVPLFSRTGYLTIISATLLITPYLFSNNKKQLFKLLLIMSFSIFLAQINITNTKSDLVELKGTNVTARSDIFSVTFKMILDNPISGYGYGNFERRYLDYNNQLKLRKQEINQPLPNLSHPHNEVLYWVSEGGIAALLGLIFFFVAYMKSWLQISNKQAKRLAILGLITPLLLHSLLEFPFYSSVAHWIIFIILLWYTDVISDNEEQNIVINKTFLLRFLAILLPVIFLPFLATTLHTGIIITAHEKNDNQNIKSFEKIINPVAWQSRLNANVYSHLLVTGLKNREPQKLQQYIDWALIRVRYNPRPSVYSNILLCLKILGKQEQYKEVLSEAKTTYPLINVWGKNLKLQDIK
jgi:O-antigen polymerase